MIRPSTDRGTLKSIIEALIFASEEPLSGEMIARLINGDRDDATLSEPPPLVELMDDASAPPVGDITNGHGATGHDQPASAAELAGAMAKATARGARKQRGLQASQVAEIVEELNGDYEETLRSFRIRDVAGGYQFATLRDFGEYVALLSRDKSRRRLSPAALETLAIISYRQPVSKPEIEAIRGVNCDQVLVNLMEKNLVAITGRSEGVGRPLLYGTTEDFLRTFGLKGLGDLPKLRELEELMEDDAYQAERAEVITITMDTDVEEIEARVGAAGHDDAGHEGAAPEGTEPDTESNTGMMNEDDATVAEE